MSTIIKVNGTTIKVHNKSNESNNNDVFTQLDKESKSLESLAINISKSIETLNLISDIKTMESFGYKSTEGVGEKIKSGLQFIWKKIKEFFIKLGNYIKDFFMTGGLKTRAAHLLKKVEATDEKDIDFNVSNSENEAALAIALKPMPIGTVAHLIRSGYHGMKMNDEVVSRAIRTGLNDYDLKKIEETRQNLLQADDDFIKATHLDANRNGSFSLAKADIGSKSKIIEYLKSVISGTDDLTKVAKELYSYSKQKINYLKAIEKTLEDDNIVKTMQQYTMHYAKVLNNLSKCAILFHNIVMHMISKAIKNK